MMTPRMSLYPAISTVVSKPGGEVTDKGIQAFVSFLF
jgi:hypothetical protein